MADSILVVVEQRQGKLNRVSWRRSRRTAIAAQTGWTLEAASWRGRDGGRGRGKKLAKVYAVESPKLEPYTPDAFAHALKLFLEKRPAKLVLMRTLIRCAILCRSWRRGWGVLQSRMPSATSMRRQAAFHAPDFQGKFVADVSFAGTGPCFVTFQNGAFRADKVEAGGGGAGRDGEC